MAAPMLYRQSSVTKCFKSIKCLVVPTKKNNLPFISYYSSSANNLHPLIPKQSGWKKIDESMLPEETNIDFETIKKLEKLALVKFANQEGIEKLNKAIRIADQIRLIDTTEVEPMHTVLEDRTLILREDVVTEGGNAEEIINNARKTCEEYFVVPPVKGNR